MTIASPLRPPRRRTGIPGFLWLEEIRGGGVLRIYDCTDTLLEERTYDVLSLLADE